MADVEFTQGVSDDDPRAGAGFGQMANWAGAVVSLTLLVGVGVWGYQLVMRDVSGIPVVRAVEGPMRVQPDDPGGRPADHQGLAVNAVAADGSASPPPDRLVLAPQPVALADEDAPQSELLRPEARPETVAGNAEQEVSQNRTGGLASTDIDALVERITRNVAPLTPPETVTPAAAAIVAPDPIVLDTAEATSPEPPVAADVPGVNRSIRPQSRPSSLAPVPTETLVAAPATPALDVDPADVPVGSRLVQLGAYESVEVAKEEWDRLFGKFGDYLHGKQRVVQEASSGGRTFFRLRAMGFDDLSDARRFCSALVAEGADCIPVVTR